MDLWVKAAHVVAIISWMAAILYLPRLFVYHCEAGPGTPWSETLKVMERRLMKAIMTPAMIVSWVLGLWLAHLYQTWSEPWFWVKLAGVIGLTATHFYLAKALKVFARDANEKPQRHWRVVNEVPTGLMIVIVVMVVVKPF